MASVTLRKEPHTSLLDTLKTCLAPRQPLLSQWRSIDAHWEEGCVDILSCENRLVTALDLIVHGARY